MNNLLFTTAIKEYLKYIKVKKKLNTYLTNERRINKYILNYFKDKNIYELNCKDIINWEYYIENFNFSYNYKSSLYYTFSDFINFCMLYYNLKDNVVKKVGNFKNNNIEKKGNIWTIKEFNLFINSIKNEKYIILFKILFFTGIRKGELLALKVNDINLNQNTININKTITRNHILQTPKTKSSNRIISINELLKKEIKKYINNYELENNDFLFDISFSDLKRKKDYYCNISGVKQIKIHEFRHSHACLLFNNDVPIDEISFRLGHSKISMTSDIYLKYLPRKEKRVINTLNSLYC